MRALSLVAIVAVVALVGFGGMLFDSPVPSDARESTILSNPLVLEWPVPSPTAVDSLTRLIVRANPQIRDPRRIQIGDLVRVPTTRGDTTYAAEPWALRASGAKSCFWLIAEAHLTRKAFASAKVALVDTATAITLTNPFHVAEAKPTLPPFWQVLLGTVTVLLGGLALIAFSLNRRRRNPYAVPPVVASGLGGSNDYVLAQIRRASETFYHDPGRRISDPVRGQVVSRNGEKHFTARVGQRNGTFSQRDIPNGTPCVRITVHTPERDREAQYFEYWLTHCGNPVGEVGRDRFELPAGWEFVSDVPQPPQATREPARPTTVEPAIIQLQPVPAPAATVEPAAADEPVAPAQSVSTDGRPEYAVDVQIDRTDTGLSIKGASSRYISRVKVTDDGYEVEF